MSTAYDEREAFKSESIKNQCKNRSLAHGCIFAILGSEEMYRPSIFRAIIMKKLPLSVSSFEKLIRDDYLYVDKTKTIYELIEAKRFIFYHALDALVNRYLYPL